MKFSLERTTSKESIASDADRLLKAYAGGREAKAGLDAYFRFYNTQRPHQALGYPDRSGPRC